MSSEVYLARDRERQPEILIARFPLGSTNSSIFVTSGAGVLIGSFRSCRTLGTFSKADAGAQKSEESAIARRRWKRFFTRLLQCLLYYAVVPLDVMVFTLFANRRHGREEASCSSGTQRSTSPSEWLFSTAFVFGKANWETANEAVEPADTSLAVLLFCFQVLLFVIAISLFLGLSACGTSRNGMRRPRLHVDVAAVMRGTLQGIH